MAESAAVVGVSGRFLLVSVIEVRRRGSDDRYTSAEVAVMYEYMTYMILIVNITFQTYDTMPLPSPSI